MRLNSNAPFAVTIAMMLFCLATRCVGQLPEVSNSKLAVDCVRTQDASFFGIVIEQDRQVVKLVVERKWLENTFPDQFIAFRKIEDARIATLIQEYEERIDDWIDERATLENLVARLKEERARIRESNTPEKIAAKKFMVLSFEPKKVKHVFLQAAERKQTAAIAWHNELPNVTVQPERQLTEAISDLKGSFQEARVGLAQQLPASELNDAQWELRKAMFEYSVLQEMEFQGYGDVLMNASTAGAGIDLGQVLNSLMSEQGLAGEVGMDLGAFGKELGLPEFQQNRPAASGDWKTNLTAQADKQGYRSVMVKRSLPVTKSDWVEVEMTFLAKTKNGWQTVKTVTATAQISKQDPDDVDRIAADPQVKSAIDMMKGIGLDADPQLFNQALVQGAAVERATQTANEQMGEFLLLNTLQLDLPFVAN